MKLLHLSDLHIGKRLNEYSMLEDQRYILTKILNIADTVKPDGILIAGDVYDRSNPSDEAVKELENFLVKLHEKRIPTFIIAGNHDSAVKLSFGSALMEASGIHIAPAYSGRVPFYDLVSGDVTARIHLLPFIKPSTVKAVFSEEADNIHNYTDGIRVALSKAERSEAAANILIAHQFVTGAERSDSEEVSVGGLDNVDASAFDGFDYVALGHIHGPQKVSRDTIRYCGTPLKYSFSEKDQEKSITVVNIDEKGQVSLDFIPLIPKHDLREVKGSFAEVISGEKDNNDMNDYVHVVLTDEEDVMDAVAKLRSIYPNIMKLSYDNARTRNQNDSLGTVTVEGKSEIDLFMEFYELQNGRPMSEEQKDFSIKIIERLKEDN